VHPQLLQNVVAELQTNLTGRYLGKIYQLSPVSFAFDFGLRGTFLFVSVDPASPRMYLIRRRPKDLEKQSLSLGSFGQLLRARFGGQPIGGIQKDESDRIVRLAFPSGTLIVQLTGRTADLFVLDDHDLIVASLRTRIEGIYILPPVREIRVEEDLPQATGSPS
jgi:predicted ribosome quality control (RQC) complex YloA/Tae2 family protein